jgi:hypothetical protein
MDVEVLDYDGPFAEAESLGHAEINFLKMSPGDLSDFWIPLSGKNARAHGSKLHLRVFLTNTRDGDALPDYLERVEREVGLKVTLLEFVEIALRIAQCCRCLLKQNACIQTFFASPIMKAFLEAERKKIVRSIVGETH